MISFIRHFLLVVPVPAFCSCPVPIFLEFYLTNIHARLCLNCSIPVESRGKEFIPNFSAHPKVFLAYFPLHAFQPAFYNFSSIWGEKCPFIFHQWFYVPILLLSVACSSTSILGIKSTSVPVNCSVRILTNLACLARWRKISWHCVIIEVSKWAVSMGVTYILINQWFSLGYSKYLTPYTFTVHLYTHILLPSNTWKGYIQSYYHFKPLLRPY